MDGKECKDFLILWGVRAKREQKTADSLRLRARSVWVARMRGFPSILRRGGGDGDFYDPLLQQNLHRREHMVGNFMGVGYLEQLGIAWGAIG